MAPASRHVQDEVGAADRPSLLPIGFVPALLNICQAMVNKNGWYGTPSALCIKVKCFSILLQSWLCGRQQKRNSIPGWEFLVRRAPPAHRCKETMRGGDSFLSSMTH